MPELHNSYTQHAVPYNSQAAAAAAPIRIHGQHLLSMIWVEPTQPQAVHIRQFIKPLPKARTSAVHAVGRRAVALALPVLHLKVKVDVVDRDLELARVVLLRARQERLRARGRGAGEGISGRGATGFLYTTST